MWNYLVRIAVSDIFTAFDQMKHSILAIANNSMQVDINSRIAALK
jgi:hypothetical protein